MIIVLKNLRPKKKTKLVWKQTKLKIKQQINHQLMRKSIKKRLKMKTNMVDKNSK